MFLSLSFSRFQHWFLKGGIAILDQGIFSGSNFVLNILFARWLRPDEYGAFAVSFAIYLFVSGFQNALVLEPMTLFGTAKYSNALREYLAGQSSINFFVTGASGIIIFTAGLALYGSHLTEKILSLSIMGVGVFLPLMLSIWLARRSCYVLEKPIWALASSSLYSTILFISVFYLHQHNQLVSPFSWFFVLGISGFAGWLLIFMNPYMLTVKRTKWWLWLQEQWSFGKWIVLAAFLNFAGTQVQLFVVAAQLGLDQAGAFRALQNFMLPMMQILTAISTLVLPSISMDFGRRNYFSMRNKASKVTLVLIFFAFVYSIFLFAFGDLAEQFLYNGKFAQYSLLISLTGFIPLLTSVETGFSLVVRSLQRPSYYVILTGTIAVVGMVLSFLLIPYWGLAGAVFSSILVACTSLGINIWLYRRWFIPQLTIEKYHK